MARDKPLQPSASGRRGRSSVILSTASELLGGRRRVSDGSRFAGTRCEDREMSDSAKMNPSLEDYASSYIELFGEMPEVPGKRFDDLAEISPDFVEAFERLRAVGFYSDVFDVKTTQLIAFAHLLRAGHFAAYWHARAARRAGATWEELVKVVEIGVSTDGGMQVINDGIKIIERLRQEASQT